MTDEELKQRWLNGEIDEKTYRTLLDRRKQSRAENYMRLNGLYPEDEREKWARMREQYAMKKLPPASPLTKARESVTTVR